MKRIITFFFGLLLIVPLFAQGAKGSWNPTTLTYTNTVHKISWALPKEIGWKRADATGSHILFKAIDPETGTMLTLGVRTDQDYGTDAWSFYTDLNSKEHKDYLIKGSRAAGVNIKTIDVAKSQLNGIHAIKTTTSMRKNDPGFGGNVDMISIGYSFVMDNKFYSVDIQALRLLKDELEGFDQVINMIFKGVKITK